MKYFESLFDFLRILSLKLPIGQFLGIYGAESGFRIKRA